MRKRLICTTLSILVGGCCLSGTSMAQVSTPILDRGEGAWSSSVLADGLDYPWDIVRDGGRLILTEKAGTVVIIEGGNVQRSTLQTSDPLRTEGGAGLLGIALAPDFADSGRAFFYYSYSSGSESANRVVAARFDGNTWRETAVLVDAIPGHRLYNGGRIAIGPDDHLYVTTGTLAGGVPEDNPFQGSFVYSFGHRNPQGLAWNAEGELFVSEHGQAALDEINLIAPGANYGWPIISGDETQEGMQPPFVHSGGDTWAPSGIAFAGNELLVTALQGRGLYVLDRQARTLQPVVSLGERVRHVLPVGDDLLLITTNRSPRGQGPSKDRLVRLSAQN